MSPLVPMVISAAAFFVAGIKAPEGGAYGAGHVIGFVFFMMALTVSLTAWLAWALMS